MKLTQTLGDRQEDTIVRNDVIIRESILSTYYQAEQPYSRLRVSGTFNSLRNSDQTVSRPSLSE